MSRLLIGTGIALVMALTPALAADPPLRAEPIRQRERRNKVLHHLRLEQPRTRSRQRR